MNSETGDKPMNDRRLEQGYSFEKDPQKAWEEWEKRCVVPPVRFALVNLNKPFDIAQAAQVSLATTVNVPHVGFEMVGVTLDFTNPKVASKVESWTISKESLDTIPRRKNSLQELKNQGFRLVGTVPNSGNNALDFKWSDKDVIVIGGANGLSRDNLALMDEVITIPCAIPFMTTPTVIPILTYSILNSRNLWKK